MSRIRLGKFLRFSKLGKIIREKLHERRRRRRAKREYKRFVTGPFRNTMALKIFRFPIPEDAFQLSLIALASRRSSEVSQRLPSSPHCWPTEWMPICG